MEETITYDKFWECFMHKGSVITDLEKFVKITLDLGNTVNFEIDENGDMDYHDDHDCDASVTAYGKRFDCEV